MKFIYSFIVFSLSSLISTSQSADSCADVIADCRSYGQATCSSYPDWAKANCAYTCGYCSGPPQTKECKDTATNCASYAAEMCTSDSYKTWAEDHCPLYCGFCTAGATITLPTLAPATQAPVTQAPAAGCSDTLGFCLVYSKDACNDLTWATVYCKKYCALC